MKNLTKSKTAMSLLLIGLAAIIIGGATMAWFTDSTEVADATFTAGTVEIEAGDSVFPEGKLYDNINPGDCGRVTWDIVNTGTKAIELRVKMTEAWTGVGSETESTANPFYYCPPSDSDWVMYEEEGETWLYYTGGSVPGTYSDATVEERTVPLTLVVGFDGAEMDNDYQGASVTLGGEESGSIVEAVQASNGAPEAVWGDVWTEVTGENYSFLSLRGANYFYNGLGKDMPCWGGGEGPVDPDPTPNTVVANVLPGDLEGTVDGIGTYASGASVSLTAPLTINGYTFKDWTVNSPVGLDYTATGNTLSFVMPAEGVSVTANYNAPVPVKKYNVTVEKETKDNKNGTITGAGEYAEDDDVTVTATPTTNKTKVKWYIWKTGYGGGYWDEFNVSDNSYEFDMPGHDVKLKVKFEKKNW